MTKALRKNASSQTSGAASATLDCDTHRANAAREAERSGPLDWLEDLLSRFGLGWDGFDEHADTSACESSPLPDHLTGASPGQAPTGDTTPAPRAPAQDDRAAQTPDPALQEAAEQVGADADAAEASDAEQDGAGGLAFAGLARVVDGNAWIRTAPPALEPIGEDLVQGGTVNVRTVERHDGRDYAEVEVLDAQGQGTGRVVWTLGTNLRSDKEYGDDLAPANPVDVAQFSGQERQMAEAHNKWGGFFEAKATELAIEQEAAGAVTSVEAAGRGFAPDGQMIIRFENHIFWDQWGAANPERFRQHFRFDESGQRWTNHAFRTDPAGAWRSFHGNQQLEWEVFQFARQLDEEAAMRSISMGAGQVMGFNAELVGFDSVDAMYEACQGGIGGQFDAMFGYIESVPACLQGLQTEDYHRFAAAYNGTGRAATYEALILEAVQAYRNVLAQAGDGPSQA